MEEPRDGETGAMACDGCGQSIVVTFDGERAMWVGDFIVTTAETILHPACVQADDALDQDNAMRFMAYLKNQVGA